MSTDEQIMDVLSEFPNAVKAEKKGNNVLILRKIRPIKRMDGKIACRELEYRWIRPNADVHCVLGSDFSYWQAKELNLNKSIFEQVNLF